MIIVRKRESLRLLDIIYKLIEQHEDMYIYIYLYIYI